MDNYLFGRMIRLLLSGTYEVLHKSHLNIELFEGVSVYLLNCVRIIEIIQARSVVIFSSTHKYMI